MKDRVLGLSRTGMAELEPRRILAPNASPMTLGGTITYVVGRDMVAIIDPGSADVTHLDSLAAIIEAATHAVVLVTHDHPDHSTGAIELVDRTGAALLGGHTGDAASEGHPGGHGRIEDMPDHHMRREARAVSLSPGQATRAAGGGLLADGVSIETDQGDLIVIRTPGHSPDHIALHWPAASAIFCGDLMMGGLDTAVVAAPEGDLLAYLDSLERIRALDARIIYPSHGPPFTDPDAAIDRYIRHRRERVAQVRDAMEAGAEDTRSIADGIYGDALNATLRPFAEAAVEAYIAYIRATSRT